MKIKVSQTWVFAAHATVDEVVQGHKRRKHRITLLNKMEEVIIIHKSMITQDEDIAFENIRRIKYKPKLSTKEHGW